MSDENVNIPLLRKVVEWVEAEDQRPMEEREWNQGTWFHNQEYQRASSEAGMHACASVSFSDPLYDEHYREAYEEKFLEVFDETKINACGTKACVAGRLVSEYSDFKDFAVRLNRGDTDWDVEASKILGIEDSRGLFRGSNNASEVSTIAEQIAGEKL